MFTCSPLIQVNPQHLPVEPSGVEDELGQLCRVIHQDSFRHEVADALEGDTGRREHEAGASQGVGSVANLALLLLM